MLDVGFLGQINLYAEDVTVADWLQFVHRLGESFIAATVDHDVRAYSGQCLGGRLAQTAD